MEKIGRELQKKTQNSTWCNGEHSGVRYPLLAIEFFAIISDVHGEWALETYVW